MLRNDVYIAEVLLKLVFVPDSRRTNTSMHEIDSFSRRNDGMRLAFDRQLDASPREYRQRFSSSKAV